MRATTKLCLLVAAAVLVVTVSSAGVRAEVYCDSCEECNTAIAAGSSPVVLSADIVTTEHCISIQRDNIVFDCDGHTIQGDGAPDMAIRVFGTISVDLNNVTVQNCTTVGFGSGIMLWHTYASKVLSNHTNDSGNEGIGAWYSTNTVIQNNESTRNWWGVHLATNTGLTMSGNVFCDNNKYDVLAEDTTGTGMENTCDILYEWPDYPPYDQWECSSPCEECTTDEDCDDGRPCTDDTCVDSACEHTNNIAPCDDDNVCTTGDTCSGGTCAGTAINCDDTDACTNDSCDPATGCVNAAIICDDGNICTDDTCNVATGCVVANNTAPCSDGDACTGPDACSGGACVPGPAVVCDDEDVCNGAETCDTVAGCQAGTPLLCDDGNVCNGAETCDPVGGCQAGTPLVCDDGNVCNGAETCDAVAGCQAGTPLVCDDGSACTNDSCDPATGCVNEEISCDDTNSCTSDSCDPATGCVHVEISCDDTNACTSDSCDPAVGCVNAAISCDDANACTNDSCDPAIGCVNGCSATGSADPCCTDPACTGVPICEAPPCTDADGDGYGNPASLLCTYPELDCNDSDAAVNPGATEIPENGIDDDCNYTTPAWGTPASTMGTLKEKRLSDIMNNLLMLSVPLGIIGLRRRLRRKK